MILKLALRIRIYSRGFIIVLLLPILIAVVGPLLVGQAHDAPTTLLAQLLITPAYRPYVWMLLLLILLTCAIEPLALVEERRSGRTDLRKYLQELARTHEMLAPDGFFQQSALGIVGVPLETVFIHLQAVSDRPRFGLADEQQETLTALRRRTDLAQAQQEELIQALRVRWYSQVGRSSLETPGKVAVEQLLQSATVSHPGVVLLGAPGSGKSTTLRWLLLHMAQAACLPWYQRWLSVLSRLLSRLFRRSFRPGKQLPAGLAPRQIPLYFKASEYVKACPPHADLASVQSYLAAFFAREYEHLPRLAGRLLQELANGRCLVLIDGLDEVASDQRRRQVAEHLAAFCEHYTNEERRYNRFLITSRIVGYEANKFPFYTHYTLQDLDDAQIEGFLSHWCPVVERYRMQAAQSSRKLSPEQQARANKDGRIHYRRLHDALKQHPGIKKLALNSLMLTLLALLQQSGRTLPHRRVELYHIVTRTLLDNWNLQTQRRVFPPDEITLAEELLSHLAYEMHSRDLLLTEASVKEIACQTMTAFYQQRPSEEKIQRFIDTIRQSSGLFVEGGQGLFCFMHRTFQEYYAAQYLLARPADEQRSFVQRHCHHALWHEPFLLLIAEKSARNDQEASGLIRIILRTKKNYDTVLQRHVLLAASCVIDCNVWRIDHTLQHLIARRLFELYGDRFGDGRYHSLRQEIQRLALLWLRGQPAGSSNALPPLLTAWHESLCGTVSPLHQEGASSLLYNLALDLPECPELVLSSLLPPLVALAGLLELPDFPLPAAIRQRCASLSIQHAPIQITEYALATLRSLDSDGPAEWLHRAWLTWSKEQPELLQRLSEHALELEWLLTPAAFPAMRSDPAWQKQLALAQNWQKRARRNALDLQVQLLQSSTAARLPRSYLYWQILRQETTESVQNHYWQTEWQTLLQQEMASGRRATYQTCVNLRLLLTKQQSQQQQALASEITSALSSQDQQQPLAILTLTNLYLFDLFDLRVLRDPRVLFDLRVLRVLREFRDFRVLRVLLDHKEIALTLCCLLTSGTNNPTILLLALYSLIAANGEIRARLLQPVEQALQQFESGFPQRPLPAKEQAYLLKAIRRLLSPEASTPHTSRFAGATTPEARAEHLVTLKQRTQLSKTDIEELLDACGDTREISTELWHKFMQVSSGNRQIGHLAWSQLSELLKLSNEAWMALRDSLERPEPLVCGAAVQVFQASNDVPALVRKRAGQTILDMLHGKEPSYRALDTPNDQSLYLDDELFQTLQTLAEQDEKKT